MSIESLNDLFEDMLKDVYYAEKKITKELPKMAKAATSPKLKKAFESHLEETEGQIERLEQVFEIIGKKPVAKKCDAIEGIAAEAKEIMDEAEEGAVLDAGLLSTGQAVEHYEMARYGTLCEWAHQLGFHDAEKLLRETLDQEKGADAKLTKIAEAGVNDNANTSSKKAA